MTPIKFHPVSQTQGYAVEKKSSGKFQVCFCSFFKDAQGNTHYKKEADSRSLGKLLEYTSPFTADWVIRREILPLYKKEAS